MAQEAGEARVVAYDADGRVDQDLPCAECGYNLRTLERTAKCVECGFDVARSARYWVMGRHSRAYLRDLRVALWLLCLGIIAATSLIAFEAWGYGNYETILGLYPSGLLLMAGAWVGLGHDKTLVWRPTAAAVIRVIARWGMILAVAVFLLFFLLSSLSHVGFPGYVVVPVLMASPLSLVIALISLGVSAHRLAGPAIRVCLFGIAGLLLVCLVVWFTAALVRENYGYRWYSWSMVLDLVTQAAAWGLLVSMGGVVYMLMWLYIAIGRVMRSRLDGTS